MKRVSFASLVQRLKEEARPTALVSIDGAGGAGKSVFAEALREYDPSIRVVHMDDFYKVTPERVRQSREIGGDFDWRRLRQQVLEPLRSGRRANYERYDWPSNRLAESHALEPGGIVVVEGVYSMRPELADLYDFSIWVDSPWDVRLARGLERDGEEMRERWVSEWMPEEDRYTDLHGPIERANLIVDGTAPLQEKGAPSFVVLRERCPNASLPAH